MGSLPGRALADYVTQDDDLDIVLANRGEGRIVVFESDGEGAFEQIFEMTVEGDYVGVVVLLGDGTGGLMESWRFRRHDIPVLTPLGIPGPFRMRGMWKTVSYNILAWPERSTLSKSSSP